MLNGSTETAGIDPGSNRLQQTSGAQIRNYSYDAAGNLIGDGTFSYGYNAEGRRISATATGQTVSYGYNALGQRISKTVNGVATRYVYAEQGHLSGEYNASGQLIQKIVWLGDLPIAALRPGATTPDIYYIHAYHLGTPRKITRPNDNRVVWRWEPEAFGNSLPDQNPSGLGSFAFNLRFPGQYYDQETGLFYNYFRDYDPATGRYVESDPIGLRGGINTYTYVYNNPLRYTDPQGLFALPLAIPLGQALVDAATVALGGAMIANSLSDAQSQANPSDKELQQAIEKEANRREYKNICSEPPPPGLNPCERARWELNKAQSCKAARNANTNKWWGGVDDVHSSQLTQDLDRAIQNAQRAVDRLCKC